MAISWLEGSPNRWRMVISYFEYIRKTKGDEPNKITMMQSKLLESKGQKNGRV